MGSYSSWSLFTHRENGLCLYFLFHNSLKLINHQPPEIIQLLVGHGYYFWVVGEWINNVFNKSKGERGSKNTWIFLNEYIQWPPQEQDEEYRGDVLGGRFLCYYLLRVRELNCLLRIHKNIGEIDSEGAAYSVSPNFSIWGASMVWYGRATNHKPTIHPWR